MWQLRFWTYFLLLALSLAPVRRVVACSCLMSHPQEIFCSSNIVILAKVKGAERLHLTKVSYRVKIRRVFRVDSIEHFPALGNIVVETAAESSACGVHLAIGGTYILSGHINENRIMSLHLCSMPRIWNTVSRSERKAYRKLYGNGCSCRIQRTPWENKGNALDNTQGKVCLWESIPGPEICQFSHGVCMPISGGCSWFHTVAYKNCIKEHQQTRGRGDSYPRWIDYIF